MSSKTTRKTGAVGAGAGSSSSSSCASSSSADKTKPVKTSSVSSSTTLQNTKKRGRDEEQKKQQQKKKQVEQEQVPEEDNEEDEENDVNDEEQVEEDEEEEEHPDGGAAKVTIPAGVVAYTNKQRVLVFGSRGLTARYRHLMEDIRSLIPHNKKESKLDNSENLAVVNDIAQMKGCNLSIFFESRKHRDLYMWVAATPSGPSVKFHVVNVHTMDELRLTGNCLRGSRPILSFDKAFDDETATPHLRLIRELFTQAFATPRGHPKSQPFHDHVISLAVVENKIWFRHYQIVDKAADAKAAARMLAAGEQPTMLVEIGPRFVLDIIRVFGGSMGGASLYSNPDYIAPNLLRHEYAKLKAGKYVTRKEQEGARAVRADELEVAPDPLDAVFK